MDKREAPGTATRSGRHLVRPAAARLSLLRDYGMPVSIAAELAGVASDELLALLEPKPRNADRAAAAVHTLTFAPARHHRYALAVGAHRRVRALAAMGWSTADIAERSTVSRAALAKIRERGVISTTTWAEVARVYDDLSMRMGPNAQLRTTSRRAGWAPPLAWDDDELDDPRATPQQPKAGSRGEADHVVVYRALHGDRSLTLSLAERREIFLHCVNHDWSNDRIAELLDRPVATVRRTRTRIKQ